MLEGRIVNLRVLEKEDLPLLTKWLDDPKVSGEFNPICQSSREDMEKTPSSPYEHKQFIVEKKDGCEVGVIDHFFILHPAGRQLEVGYSIIPDERGNGYCTEALEIMVDYLFLCKDVNRIQAQTDQRNLASQRVLQKVGFKHEGVLRESMFIRGDWRDICIYGILKDEWREPKVLPRKSH